MAIVTTADSKKLSQFGERRKSSSLSVKLLAATGLAALGIGGYAAVKNFDGGINAVGFGEDVVQVLKDGRDLTSKVVVGGGGYILDKAGDAGSWTINAVSEVPDATMGLIYRLNNSDSPTQINDQGQSGLARAISNVSNGIVDDFKNLLSEEKTAIAKLLGGFGGSASNLDCENVPEFTYTPEGKAAPLTLNYNHVDAEIVFSSKGKKLNTPLDEVNKEFRKELGIPGNTESGKFFSSALYCGTPDK